MIHGARKEGDRAGIPLRVRSGGRLPGPEPQLNTLTLGTASFATPYSTKDAVGIPQAVTLVDELGGMCLLEGLVLVDTANQKAAVRALFFNADPVAAGATLTDNAIAKIAPAASVLVGMVRVEVADWETFGTAADTVAVAHMKSLRIPLVAAPGSQSIWVAFTSEGGATYSSATCLKAGLQTLQV